MTADANGDGAGAYAAIHGLRMHYEVHGSGRHGTPHQLRQGVDGEFVIIGEHSTS